jgi:hypothetical protein
MNIIIAIAIFFIGNVSGFFFRGFFEKRAFHMTEQASKNFLIVLITLTWVFAMAVDVSNPNYDVPLAVHGILGVIVGFFFARPTQGGDNEK